MFMNINVRINVKSSKRKDFNDEKRKLIAIKARYVNSNPTRKFLIFIYFFFDK